MQENRMSKSKRPHKTASKRLNLCTLFELFLSRNIIPITPMGGHLDEELDGPAQTSLTRNLRIVKNP